MKHWRGPRYPGEVPTLGYQVCDWITDSLPSPAEDSKPFVLTQEQASIVLRIYALDPLSGRPLYRRTELEQPKGWGKSPIAAAMALAEFRGPVVFDGWDAQGEPVGVRWGTGELPPPWVQIAAVSEDQTDNTYTVLYATLTTNEQRAAKALGIDQGRTRLYLRDMPGAKLEPVTAAFGSREGQRVTFGVLDETFLWTPRNGGVKLARTLRRNVAKMGGRTLETTNAPTLGERSVAEMTSEDTHEPGVLHIANRPDEEPQPDWTQDRMVAALRQVYGEARWIDQARILAEIADPASDWSDSVRFYFNTRTTGAGRAVDPKRWAQLKRDTGRPAPGTYIGAGFDGSISQDDTVLRGCTAEGYSFELGSWSRPADAPPGWTVPRLVVHQAVAEMFATYRVGLMLCDPPKWWTEVETWAAKYPDSEGKPRVLALDTNQDRRMAPVVDRFVLTLAPTSPG